MALVKPVIVKGVQLVNVAGSALARAPFTAGDILGKKLIDTLNLLRADVNDAFGILSTGETSPEYFEDLTLDATGKPFGVVHNLKRRVRWVLVDWTPATTGQGALVERHNDATVADLSSDTKLVLRSYRAGTATIRVW